MAGGYAYWLNKIRRVKIKNAGGFHSLQKEVTKRLAERQEPAVIIPMIVIPIEVQVPVIVITVEIRHITITIRIDPGRAQRACRIPSMPLLLEYSWDCIVFGKFISLISCTK